MRLPAQSHKHASTPLHARFFSLATEQVYLIQNSDLALTGTAEVPLGGIYMDQILEESELPIKMVAFGHCFRTEAGAPGVASKGLYRVHQFSKIEMFVISTPSQSEALLEELRTIEEELYTQLGLHFKAKAFYNNFRKLVFRFWTCRRRI